MLEDVSTIEKSMMQIGSLSGEESPDWNQLVRWVHNKEQYESQANHRREILYTAARAHPPIQKFVSGREVSLTVADSIGTIRA